MTTETVLTTQEILHEYHNTDTDFDFARAIEQAVLQSPEVRELRKEARRLDKLEQDYFEPVEGGIRKHIDHQIEIDAETYGPKSKLKLVVSK